MTYPKHPALAFLVAAALALVLTGCTTELAAPVATATARPTGTAIPARTPTPTPLVWWQAELYEVSDLNNGTYLMAPQEVIEQVIAHYDDARALAQADTLETYKAALPLTFTARLEALQTELIVINQRPADVSNPYQSNLPIVRQSHNPSKVFPQINHSVTQSASAECSKTRKVLANLGGSDTVVLR